MCKRVIVGEIEDNYVKPPVEMFKLALKLSKMDKFLIKTNNPQFLEALEILCGEENLEVYLKLNGDCVEVDVMTAYNYLGDFYGTINVMRFRKELSHKNLEDEFFEEEIEKYVKKYDEVIKDGTSSSLC